MRMLLEQARNYAQQADETIEIPPFTEELLFTKASADFGWSDISPTVAESRSKAICDVPQIGIGNKPIDGGNYLFTKEEKEEFAKKEPLAEKWFMPWVGSQEFINRYYRYFLWFGDCPSNELRKMPECMKRVQAILDARELYPDSSFADLYDELAIPIELRKAHMQNDKAVMQAYGFPVKGTTEESCMAEMGSSPFPPQQGHASAGGRCEPGLYPRPVGPYLSGKWQRSPYRYV